MSSIQNDRQDPTLENQLNQLNQFRSSGWETAFKTGVVIGALALFASGTMLAAYFCPHLVAYSQISFYASVVGLPTSFVLLSVSTAGAILAHRRNEKKWQQAIEDLRTLLTEPEKNDESSGSEGNEKPEEDRKIQKLERKNTRLKEKLETAEKDHEGLVAEKLDLDREKENKEKTIQNLTEQLRKAQEDLDKANRDNQTFGDEVAVLKNKLESAKVNHLLEDGRKAFSESKTPEEAKEKIENLKKNLEDRSSKPERKAKLEEAQKGIDRLKQQLEEVERGRQEIISLLEQNLARSEKKRAELEEELQKLKSESAASSKSEKKSKSSNDANVKKIQELEDEIASRDASLIIAETDLTQARKEIAELEKRLKTDEKPMKTENSLGLSDIGFPGSYIDGLKKKVADRDAKKEETKEMPRSSALDKILEEYDESELDSVTPLSIDDLEKKQPDPKGVTAVDKTIRPPSQSSSTNPRSLPVLPMGSSSSVASRKAAFETPKKTEPKPPAVIYGKKEEKQIEDKQSTAEGGTSISMKKLAKAKEKANDSDPSSFLKEVLTAGRQQDLNDSITEDNLLDSVSEHILAEKEKKEPIKPKGGVLVPQEAIARAVGAINLSPSKTQPINNDLTDSWLDP